MRLAWIKSRWEGPKAKKLVTRLEADGHPIGLLGLPIDLARYVGKSWLKRRQFEDGQTRYFWLRAESLAQLANLAVHAAAAPDLAHRQIENLPPPATLDFLPPVIDPAPMKVASTRCRGWRPSPARHRRAAAGPGVALIARERSP